MNLCVFENKNKFWLNICCLRGKLFFMKTKIILVTISLVFTNIFAQGKLDTAKENLKKQSIVLIQ